MSYTIVHKVPETGGITEGFEIHNAWLGAMHIWESMYWRYVHVGARDEFSFGMMMTRDLDKPNGIKRVWDLAKETRVPIDERIVLTTTFDGVMVKREHLPRLAEAFRVFIRSGHDNTSNISLQIQAYDKLALDETCYAVCWTQTSVAGDAWLVYEEDKDDHRPYDISRDSKHWFLFNDEMFEKALVK